MKIAIAAVAAVLLSLAAHAKEPKKAAAKPAKKSCVAACAKSRKAELDACGGKAGDDKASCKKAARAAAKKCEAACPAK